MQDDGGHAGEVYRNKDLHAEKKQIEEELARLRDFDSKMRDEPLPLMPVEFRELRHPEKDQAQGIMEMWVEVLTIEEQRANPPFKLTQATRKEDYEIRLIIWETREIPLGDGDASDVYIRAIFQTDGLQTPSIEKTTDTHFKCRDGTALFNYRMKFPLSMPAEFPRIKLQVYDYDLMGGDNSLGETTLNIKNTVNILNKHGELEDRKCWLTF